MLNLSNRPSPSLPYPILAESLGLAYCGLPKVASTSWRMWFRFMLNLPNPENHFLAHSYEHSGLGDLSQKFTEEQACRLMTRRSMFKFTFVRNPFVRISSTYLNKHVITDAPDRTTGWGTRSFWNQVRWLVPAARVWLFCVAEVLHRNEDLQPWETSLPLASTQKMFGQVKF